MRTTELQIGEPYPFYKRYIDVLGDVELRDMMQRQMDNFPEFMESIPDGNWNFRYAEGKWTVVEILQHVIDTERIFQYRAFRFSRGDKTPLPGFDQNDYAEKSKAQRRSKESLIEEYRTVRKSTISLFANLDRDDLDTTGTASTMEWSVAALGFAICGHQKHHRNIIRERYL